MLVALLCADYTEDDLFDLMQDGKLATYLLPQWIFCVIFSLSPVSFLVDSVEHCTCNLAVVLFGVLLVLVCVRLFSTPTGRACQ